MATFRNARNYFCFVLIVGFHFAISTPCFASPQNSFIFDSQTVAAYTELIGVFQIIPPKSVQAIGIPRDESVIKIEDELDRVFNEERSRFSFCWEKVSWKAKPAQLSATVYMNLDAAGFVRNISADLSGGESSGANEMLAKCFLRVLEKTRGPTSDTDHMFRYLIKFFP